VPLITPEDATERAPYVVPVFRDGSTWVAVDATDNAGIRADALARLSDSEREHWVDWFAAAKELR
jgi:hypothetical protein